MCSQDFSGRRSSSGATPRNTQVIWVAPGSQHHSFGHHVWPELQRTKGRDPRVVTQAHRLACLVSRSERPWLYDEASFPDEVVQLAVHILR